MYGTIAYLTQRVNVYLLLYEAFGANIPNVVFFKISNEIE